MYLWRLHYGVDDAVSKESSYAAFRFNAEENASESEQRKQRQRSTRRCSAEHQNTLAIQRILLSPVSQKQRAALFSTITVAVLERFWKQDKYSTIYLLNGMMTS